MKSLRFRMFLAALALASTVFAARTTSAYVILFNWDNNPEKWARNQITWTWSGTIPPGLTKAIAVQALTNAFSAWQSVTCSAISFTSGGERSDPNNAIHISFQYNTWDPTVSDALAYSTSETYRDGSIASNDIVFNVVDVQWAATFPPPSGRQDLQSVATHEIGHAIGLDHTRETDAMMFFTETLAHNRQLHPDDQRGACFLYPIGTFNSGEACDACFENGHCRSGVCFDWGDGTAFCGAACSGSNPCPNGFTCYRVDGVAEAQCLPDNDNCAPIGSNVPIGGPCYGHEVCASGFCLVGDGDPFCSKQCARDSDCGSGLACLGGLCFRAGDGAYGDSCESVGDCESLVCVQYAFLRARCTENCGAGLPACPNGDRCLEGTCVPSGDGAIGLACSGPDECRHGYCEDGACTRPCGNVACPRGTSCDGGFCVGSELGVACTSDGDRCPDGLACLPGVRTCERLCNPISETGCGDGEVCAWVAGSGERIDGRCIAANGGAGIAYPCAPSACEANLVCQADLDGQAGCRRDCRVSDGFGCEFYETCVPLDPVAGMPGGADDSRRGSCVPKPSAPGPEPGAEPVPDAAGTVDAGVGSDTGGSGGNGEVGARDGGGCAGGSGAWPLAFAAWLAWWARRKTLRAIF